jgi:hypothetical protein
MWRFFTQRKKARPIPASAIADDTDIRVSSSSVSS